MSFRIIFLLLLFLLQMSLFGQGVVTYRCTTTTGLRELDGMAQLYFDDSSSVFIHRDAPVKDDFIHTDFGGYAVIGDTEGWPIYINYNTDSVIYKTNAARRNKYILSEKVPDINWVIGEYVSTTFGLNCITATGEFGGRIYNVLFTPDIPFSGGPHKLNGLPGLILQAYSSDGVVSFDFDNYSATIDEDIKIAPPKQGKIASLADIKKMFISSLLRTESMSTPSVRMTDYDPPSNFEIEKSKWTFISEYKKKR